MSDRVDLAQLLLEERPEGILLPVQAQPGARKNAVIGLHAGRLKVAVTQAPEQGKANSALEKVLAQQLGLKKSQVRHQSGATSREKTFLISGLSLSELRARIQSLLAGE